MGRAYEVRSAAEDAELVIRWLVDCVAEAEAGGFAWGDRGAVTDALNEARDWRVRYGKPESTDTFRSASRSPGGWLDHASNTKEVANGR